MSGHVRLSAEEDGRVEGGAVANGPLFRPVRGTRPNHGPGGRLPAGFIGRVCEQAATTGYLLLRTIGIFVINQSCILSSIASLILPS